MAHPTAVINVVGLSRSLLGEHAPNLRDFIAGHTLRPLQPVLPAVTCSVQSSMLTGLPVSGHGIVGNGWYHRDLAEVRFWHRANHLVQGEKVWDVARQRDPSVTCANLCWWYNTYANCEQVVNVRPIYKADGRKLPDCYSQPPGLRDHLQRELGVFPLFNFWGPGASIASSRWIADAAMLVHRRYQPTLSLVYLPHLDYPLQKLGPDHPEIPRHVRQIDEVLGTLLRYYRQQDVRVLIVSEYGIESVCEATPINRVLREAGLLQVRDELGHELLEAGASAAFTVVDHQIAHVYVQDASQLEAVRALCEKTPGVARVLDRQTQRELGMAHERGGELVLIAEHGRWFTYDYWLDDRRAPDFARTVDIHRKPGYDPRELFIDPNLWWPRAAIAWRLAKRAMGMRMLMDVIPLDTALVRGSHGRTDLPADLQPLIIGNHLPHADDANCPLPCVQVREVILANLFH